MHPAKKTGLLIVVGLAIGIAADRFGSAQNIIAVHNKSSSQYNKNCTECHGQILSEQSLNSAVPTAHRAMRSKVPGKDNNVRCAFCHRTTDLLLGSTGNVRRHVDVTLCALCHGPSRAAKHFYQSGPDPTQPDGASLYTLACSPCHGALATSKVLGESASDIQKKIAENEAGMGPLNILTPIEIQAIAQALSR